MMFFRLQFSIILLLIQAYLYFKLRSAVRQSRLREPLRRVLRVAMLPALLYVNLPWMYLAVAGIPGVPIPRAIVYGLVYPFWIWILPSVLILFPILLIKDLTVGLARGVAWCVRRLRRVSPEEPAVATTPPVTRRQFLRYAAVSVMAAPVGVASYGTVFGMRRYEVVRPEIPLHGVPSGLAGFRIVQVSDVHSNLYMDKPSMDEIVKIVNELGADLIVLTGDYVSYSADFIHPFTEAFQALRTPPYGIYATLGNHDFWTNARVITVAIKEIGIKVLRNETAVIPINGERLNLIGIDYGGSSMRGTRGRPGMFSWPTLSAMIDRALRSAHPDGFSVLLSHNPKGFDPATERHIPLTLAGHTHGGQVVLDLPGIKISPAAIVFPYIAGLYQQSGSALYVNRGCGVTGPPIRLNCPPEITLITLT